MFGPGKGIAKAENGVPASPKRTALQLACPEIQKVPASISVPVQLPWMQVIMLDPAGKKEGKKAPSFGEDLAVPAFPEIQSRP